MSKAEDKAQVAKASSGGSQAGERLPCRGCMPDCSNYSVCDGRPWRIMPKPTA